MIIYVGQECDYYTDEQEKKLPRYVHIASPPLIVIWREKRNLFAPFWSREATATVLVSSGRNSHRTEDIIARLAQKVNIFTSLEPSFLALFLFLSKNEVGYFIKTTMKGRRI